jgi:TonB family protein
MRVHGRIYAVVCAAVGLAGAHMLRAQEATSAHLPDQFKNRELSSPPKSKKTTRESDSQRSATAPKQNTTPPPEQATPAEELPPVVTIEEKKAEPSHPVERETSNSAPAHLTKSTAPSEESAPVEKKPRPRKRSRPRTSEPPEPARSQEPVPISLSVARSMAIKAPLPKYPYEAKRRDLTGSGTCVLTVDSATGKVVDATMTQSTGSRFLDRFTVQTFKEWRFKPGTVSQLRIPISYE